MRVRLHPTTLRQEIQREGENGKDKDDPGEGHLMRVGLKTFSVKIRLKSDQGIDGSSVVWKVLDHTPVLMLRCSHFCLPASGTMMGEVPPTTS